ncbi:hypothetical protein PMAYCL1PPCAC_09855, partial [Pristionchus mayeri]
LLFYYNYVLIALQQNETKINTHSHTLETLTSLDPQVTKLHRITSCGVIVYGKVSNGKRDNQNERSQLLLHGLLLLLRLLGALSDLLVEELDEVVEGAASLVVHRLVRSGGEELQGGEALDLESLNLVLGGVDLCDDDLIGGGVLLSQLLPHGGERLAVTAPGSIELDEHALAGVLDDLIEVLADQHLHWLRVPVLGDIGRHQVLLEFAGQETLIEGDDVLGGEVGEVGSEFGEVSLERDDVHGGQLVVLDSEEVDGDARVRRLVSVHEHVQSLSLELLGSLGEGSVEGGERVRGLRGEEHHKLLNFSSEDLGSSLLRELGDQRKTVDLDPRLDDVSIELVGEHFLLALLLDHDRNRRLGVGSNRELLLKVGGRSNSKDQVINVRGDFLVGLSLSRVLYLEIGDGVDGLALGELLQSLSSLNRHGGGSGLLLE